MEFLHTAQSQKAFTIPVTETEATWVLNTALTLSDFLIHDYFPLNMESSHSYSFLLDLWSLLSL